MKAPLVSRLAAVATSLVVGALGAGCGRSASDRGLVVRVDSTPDTVFVRIDGAVPPDQERQLAIDLRIAPASDDTSLFTQIYGFTVDRRGRFWVYDRPSHTIFLFGADGRLERRIGRAGGGPGEFRSENGMAVLPDGRVAVLDAQNARISFFDSTGTFLTSWLVPAGFSTTRGLVGDRSGTMYLVRPVTPPREGEILGRMGLVRLEAGGRWADSLAPPDLPVLRQPYVANAISNGNVTGRSSTSSSYAASYYWAWHPDGYFVVANGETGEVILAPPGRRPLAIRRSAPAVTIPEEARAEERARITYSLRQTDPHWSWSGPDVPSTLAPIGRLLVSRDGRIWVRVAAPLEPIPAGELPIPRDSAAPVVRHREPTVYEIYETDGRLVGRVAAGARVEVVDADGPVVWALVRDENDLPSVVRYRMTER